MDIDRLITRRARGIDASGIRRVFNLARSITNPINLSIGQPDFPVPEPIKDAAIEAIQRDHNGYTVTQGIEPLRRRIARWLDDDLAWPVALEPSAPAGDPGLLITSGTSGALVLAMLVLLDPGDEIIIPDPYFVMYPHLATMCDASAVRCETYPDFAMTAARVEPLITERTKAVLCNAPSNPAGVVLSQPQCDELRELCQSRGVLLISDEIYDEFTYADSRTARTARTDQPRCPSPCRAPGAHESVLLVRGFGKTYGVTGWRMGYAVGPQRLIEEMGKLQQYSFVCAPASAQWGCIAALDVDMSAHVARYQARRDLVIDRLGPVTELATPGGAFYAFPRIPEHLGLSASQFVERCIERRVLTIPGSVFSSRDTHLRLSYATPMDQLEQGLDILVELMA